MAPIASRRASPWLIGAALVLLPALGASGPAAAQSDPAQVDNAVYDQRLAYRRAVRALRAGRSSEFRRQAAKLDDYALQPYLVYYQAQGRLRSMRSNEAADLRRELADTPIAARFYRQWLNAQVRRGRWDVYLEHYEASDDPAARCNYLRALYRSGERSQALSQVRDLWVSAESMPKTCDPLFEVWIAAGHLDQETVWARLTLALDAREVSLGRYLLRFFDRANAAAGQLYLNVHTKPRTVRSLSRFPNTDGGRRALRHGLLRYANREDASHALELWRQARPKYKFAEADAQYIHESLIAAAAEQGHAPDDDPQGFSAAAVERVALALVKKANWPFASRWIEALPDDVAAKPRWRYWLGRSLTEQDDADAGREHFDAISGLRNYYGFLAADATGKEPLLNAESTPADAAAQEALLEVPVVRRMAELYAVDDLVNARREWRYALTKLTPPQQRHLVELTASMGWVDQAIFGARDADLNDLVSIRFPTPFIDIYRRYAAETGLPLHLLLAVSRQESAFHLVARSSASARGLMQLLPSTARVVADLIGVARPTNNDLNDPHVNVRLGAHYLAHLLGRYGHNRALAAAAYNAGEGRVKRWLKDADGLPIDVWIENIPFRETRDYVKALIAFDCVYSRRLGTPVPVLGHHERVISRS